MSTKKVKDFKFNILNIKLQSNNRINVDGYKQMFNDAFHQKQLVNYVASEVVSFVSYSIQKMKLVLIITGCFVVLYNQMTKLLILAKWK
jgi:hypothetical protein